MNVLDTVQRIALAPIGNRVAAFVLVGVGMLTVAVGLHLTAARPDRPTTPPVAPTTGAPDRRTADAPAPARLAPAAAARVARRFLRGYLAELYGRRTTATHPLATAALRRRLAGQRPRISPATRRRHPRIQRLRLEPGAGSRVRVVATITDGGTTSYPIGIEVCPEPDGRPRVCDVLEAH